MISKMPAAKLAPATMIAGSLILLVALAAGAYQFPIQQHPLNQRHPMPYQQQKPQDHRYGSNFQPPQFQQEAPSRRSDPHESLAQQHDHQYQQYGHNEHSGQIDPNEAQQLDQLNQVVNSMTELLNEEEQQLKQQHVAPPAQPQHQPANNENLSMQQFPVLPSHQLNKVHELLSESDIRFALEELERIQQQERKAQLDSAESRHRPAIVAPATDQSDAIVVRPQLDPPTQQQQPQIPSPAALHSKDSLESLIDELDDELIEDQLVSASQEAQRLIGQGRMSPGDDGAGLSQSAQKQIFKSDQPTTTAATSTTTATAASSSTTTLAPPPTTTTINTAKRLKSNVSSTNTQAPLFTGQLNMAGSSDGAATDLAELNTALTNDFYTFHAEATAASAGVDLARQPASELQSSSKASSSAQQTNNYIQPQTQDLDQAAQQTRNSIAQQDPPQAGNQQSFSRQQQQPPPPSPFQPGPPPNQQENMVRVFRQQSVASPDQAFQLPSGNPFSSQGPQDAISNFWRPTSNQQSAPDDISQQYRSQASFTLLQPRFQSLQPAQPSFSRPDPSLQPIVGSNRPQQFQPSPQQFKPNGIPQSRPQQQQTTSLSPLISVDTSLSGVNGNSVTWNPPATINLPPQQQQPQQFSQPSQQAPPEKPFFPTPSPAGPPSPLFRGAFQGITTSEAPEVSNQPRDLRNRFRPPQSSSSGNPFNQFTSTTEPNMFSSGEQRETITTTTIGEPRFNQSPFVSTTFPTTTTSNAPTSQRASAQWNPAISSQPERDVSDSQPRSSFRSLPNNNQRFFSPNDLIGGPKDSFVSSELPPTTTRASSPSRQFNNNFITTTLPSVSASSGTRATPPAPTTSTFAGNSTAKKEDMVIYYYYYYDDNKNATVVAKNVSGSAAANGAQPPSPVPLDAAIEADGGVEDTPYMDDPAPVANMRDQLPVTSEAPSPFKSSTTTTFRPPPMRFVESTTAGQSEFSRSSSDRPISSGSVRQQFSNFQDLTSPSSISSEQPSPRQQQNRPLQLQPQFQDPGPIFTPSPNNVPSSTSSTTTTTVGTTSQRSSALRSQDHHSHSHTTPPGSRGTVGNRQPINNRLQNELIQNVLNGIGPGAQAAATQRQPLDRQAQASQIGSGSRGSSPLSNASRYGTNSNNNNNLLFDPYAGIDPVAGPTSGFGSTNMNPRDEAHSMSFNNNNPRTQQQFGRNNKPQPASPVEPTTSLRAGAQSGQQFSSQRNNVAPPTHSHQHQPAPAPIVPAMKPVQLVPVQQNQRPALQQQLPSRQLFPETDRDGSASKPARQPATSFEADVPRVEQPLNRIPAMSNGRPSAPEGNTGNGFTKSPLNVVTSTPATQPAAESNNQFVDRQRVGSSTGAVQGTGTQSTISTSVSRSFVTPQQVQVTTSVSPPTISTSTTSQSSSSAQIGTSMTNQPAQQLATQITTQASSEPSTSTQTPISTSDSSSDSSALSRRRFGNRNNRFQTRLNSISSGGRTTSSTTPPPAATSTTTTTRRPTPSTTRKSSKQLFPGRRGRLGSSPAQDTANTNSSSPIVSTSTAFSVTESSSSSSSSIPATGTRSRFGNSFTANRARSSSTSGPQPAADASTPRPSNLFGAQARASTSRPRLSFLKSTSTTTSTTTTTTTTTPRPTETADDKGELISTLPSVTLKSESRAVGSVDNAISGNLSEANLVDDSAATETDSMASDQPDEMTAKRDPSTLIRQAEFQSSTTTTTTTTAPPTTTTMISEVSSANGRNKHKVRPLFASRQRNTVLFGNRRSNGNNSTTTATA